jgi:uncharacterized HhH-GPD family protein
VAKPPALHRFPRANAKRIQELCQVIVSRYDGQAENIWTGVDSGAELVRQVGELPGFGKQKSQIFVRTTGQAVRYPAGGVARGDRRLRRGRLPEKRRRHHRRGLADEGARGEYKQAMKAAAKAEG